MTARLAVHLADHELPELQRSARILLGHPLVTTTYPNPEALVEIRRLESVLRTEFTQRFGYRLDVGRTSARLLRRPARLSADRPARRPNGREFSPWTYTFVCLALAVGEQAGRQVLASEMVERIGHRARGDEQLPVDLTVHAQRRALVDALELLDRLGVIVARDGEIESIMGEGQVLFDIDREALGRCLVASPSVLREVETAADFLVEPVGDAPDALTRAARHSINRRLVTEPVVLFDDLSEVEAEVARRTRRREADLITRLTGCEIELRREGMAIVDSTTHPLAGSAFPSGGTIAHACLLWLNALVVEVRSGIDTTSVEVPVEVPCPIEAADAAWAAMFERFGARFKASYRDRPDDLRLEVAVLLARHGLIRITAAEVFVRAVAARYAVDVRWADAPVEQSDPPTMETLW